MESMLAPLNGLQVLDFSHALAGPYCTMILGGYGANIYKIEGPEAFDMGRGWGPPYTGDQASYFLGVNANKQSLCIDLKNPQGRDLCFRLIEKADVLIENFRPGAMTRLGLDYESAHARNPRLVYCSISGYGQNGPSRDDPAMDLILQASSGLISVTGTPEGDLVRCGHSVADVTAGMNALIGILLALRAREQTGEGQYVDVSMLDSMVSAMASNFANFFGSQKPPGPMGTSFSTIVPYRTFRTADRDIALAVASERLWTAFCTAIKQPELATDPRYANNHLRVHNRGELEPMLVDLFRTRTAAEWAKRLGAAGIPCSPVRDFREVAEDPQVAARNILPVVEHETAGPHQVTGMPIKLSATPGQVKSAAPLLGQHSREILKNLLGLAETELDQLENAGVVLQHAGTVATGQRGLVGSGF